MNDSCHIEQIGCYHLKEGSQSHRSPSQERRISWSPNLPFPAFLGCFCPVFLFPQKTQWNFGGAIDLEVEILFIGHVYNCYIALQSFTLSSQGPSYALGTTSLPQRILRLEKIFKYTICLKFHLHINTAIKYHF